MPVVKSPYTHLCVQPRKVPKNTACCLIAAPENTAHCRAHLGAGEGHRSSTFKHLQEFYMTWMFEFGLRSNPGSLCVTNRCHTSRVSLSSMPAPGTEVRKNTCTKKAHERAHSAQLRGRRARTANQQQTKTSFFFVYGFFCVFLFLATISYLNSISSFYFCAYCVISER